MWRVWLFLVIAILFTAVWAAFKAALITAGVAILLLLVIWIGGSFYRRGQ